jgi:hypothetical protein
MWKVAAKVLNKQSRIADKGLLFSLEGGRGADTFSRKIPTCYEMAHGASGGGGLTVGSNSVFL